MTLPRQDDILASPITSNIKEVEYSILLDNSKLSEGSLKSECRVRCDKIGSVEKGLLIHKIGTLNRKTFEEVKTEINALLAE